MADDFWRLAALADVSLCIGVAGFVPVQVVESDNLVVKQVSVPTTKQQASKPFIQYMHPPTVKAKRKRASPLQLSILRSAFSANPFPNPGQRAAIAKQASMTERAVQIWFQNGRQARKNKQQR